jgi:hypothetical protein
LKVQQLRDIGVAEDVMAAAYPEGPESKAKNKSLHVLESHVLDCTLRKPLEQFVPVHGGAFRECFTGELVTAASGIRTMHLIEGSTSSAP